MDDDAAVAIAGLTTGFHFAIAAICAPLHNKRLLSFGESQTALQQALDGLDVEQEASLPQRVVTSARELDRTFH